MFQDITPVLADAAALAEVIGALAEEFWDQDVTRVAGIEARGLILGAAVAVELGVGFVPLRKAGRLPWKTLREAYALEYGNDALELHVDVLDVDDRVLIVDDVLATGGTARAAGALVRRAGAEVVGWTFLLAIAGLKGREQLTGAPVSVLHSV